jgi:hypothetical protein
MIVKHLGNHFYRLVADYGSSVGRLRPKTPPNSASILFLYLPRTDELMIIRGSLMLSKVELRAQMGGVK